MLWLAVHLPLLSLEAFRATLPAGDLQRPLALVARHRISAVDRQAAERGVEPGHKRATALALAPDLLLGQAEASRDAQALLAVAHAALAFTPSVSLHGPIDAPDDTVLLEVQASLRCFGGARRLLQRLRAALAPLAHSLSIASAPTALGAAWLARSALPAAQRHPRTLAELRALLDPLPVWLAGPAREHWEALQGMGLHQFADLRALPRTGLARRFGEALLADLDRAWGEAPEAHDWVTLPEHFASRLELHHRADSTEQVLHAAQLLLARLIAWAQARCARVAAFRLLMHHERRRRGELPPATELSIELAEASSDAAHLQLLLRERLARCTLAAPTLDLELRCHRLAPGAAVNSELFPSRQAEAEGLAQLLERLRARLGDEQVGWLHPRADHRPEQATKLAAAPPRPVPAAPAGRAARSPLPLRRPLWLLPQPLPLAARRAAPLFEGRVLQLLAGPERIEAGWWDGALATRDYFIAQDSDGSLLWIYRLRLPPIADSDAAAPWMLQGRFA